MRKNYKQLLTQNVEANYFAFRDEKLGQSKEDIYDSAYKIFFYENTYEHFMSEPNFTFDKNVSKFLARDGDKILDNLYDHYITYYKTVSSCEEIDDLIHDYYKTYSRGSEM